MTTFNFTQEQLKKDSSIFTATEIYQQPTTWKKTIIQIKEMKSELQKFISQVTSQNDFDVILTGAGTSEFVGNSVFSYLSSKLDFKIKSYGTTDIVATPENYISQTKPTLLVSYGRSGNSPESIGAVDAALAVNPNVYNLFITCNKNGALSKRAQSEKNCLAINLTDETHDQSFAMTSSFTNMYLSTILAFNLDNIDALAQDLQHLIDNTQNNLDNNFAYISDMVNGFDFKRLVYLGTNALKGVAQESALKMLELSAGLCVTMYDTPLGFRHGPKSIIDDETLIVIYLSDDEYSRKFEIDLIKEVSPQRKGNKVLAISSKNDEEVKSLVDYFYSFDNKTSFNNVFLGLQYICVAQLIGLYKSLALDITPDNPCPTGEVNRVVKGVTLYPYTRKGAK